MTARARRIAGLGVILRAEDYVSLVSTAPSPEALRAEFLLDPDVIFLNHGSFGATPEPVFREYQRWQRELERQPVAFLGRNADRLLDEARAKMASFIGCNADELAFNPNPTTGVNVVARSLRLQPGDEILGTDLEYGACERTWEWFTAKQGARYVRAHIPLPVTDPEAVVEAIFAAVTPRTRAIFVSHITSGTALRLPVEDITRRAHALGLLSIVDGAHAPGQIPVNLHNLGADFYAGTFHKWTCAPKGCGFLYAAPQHHGWTESPIVSWGWVEGREQHRPDNVFISRNQMQGTRDLAAYLAAPSAVEFLESHHWDAVRERCHELVVDARNRIAAHFDLPQICPEASGDFGWFRQMATIPVPSATDPVALKGRLYDDYRIEIPVTIVDGKPMLRISIQGYNGPDDVEALVTAVADLVPSIQGAA
ncbi:MAG: aminotransferase class V-fold PLP-dependent enzyme [Chloroflexia bacterium]|nr:aminotransferase class V-fold PLP-dependent enzyme [Chloroflexia bacterium]